MSQKTDGTSGCDVDLLKVKIPNWILPSFAFVTHHSFVVSRNLDLTFFLLAI
jgi:hypothetical protein